MFDLRTKSWNFVRFQKMWKNWPNWTPMWSAAAPGLKPLPSRAPKAESSGKNPRATGVLVSNLPHPRVNKTKQHTSSSTKSLSKMGWNIRITRTNQLFRVRSTILLLCLILFGTFVFVRMYVSMCNLWSGLYHHDPSSELVRDLLPRRLYHGFRKGLLTEE